MLAQMTQSRWLTALALYVVAFALCWSLITATPAFFSTDDYYHVQVAQQISQQGRLQIDFPWLPQTILNNDAFVDHHLLFHIYLVPWLSIFGAVNGAKIATTSIVAGVIVVAWLILEQQKVHWAWLWALATFGISSPFLYRLLMIRTQGASLLFLLVALSLLFQRRYRWLIPLAFAYVWLYNGFILIFAFALAYTAADALENRRLNWRPTVYTALGLLLGLIINPYFPRNIIFVLEHLGAKVDLENSIRVGQEWYPYSTGFLLTSSVGTFVALTLAFLRPSFGVHKRTTAENTLVLVTLLTLFMLLQSRRFIEYFPIFPLLLCAFAYRDFVLPQGWEMRLSRGLFVTASITICFLVLMTTRSVQTDVQNSKPINYLAGAASWLQEHTQQGTVIFQTDWDDFPHLFYHNTQNRYLVGMDPTYLQRADAQQWDLWVDVTKGDVENLAQTIASAFGTTYVVSDLNHEDFAQKAEDDALMQVVYRDAESVIWHITLPEVACDRYCLARPVG